MREFETSCKGGKAEKVLLEVVVWSTRLRVGRCWNTAAVSPNRISVLCCFASILIVCQVSFTSKK